MAIRVKDRIEANIRQADKVNNSLSIQLNSGTATVYNGSSSKSINITPAAIGAPTTGGIGATGTWGISITGNAATATRLLDNGNHVETASGTTGNAPSTGMLYNSGLYMTKTYNDSNTPVGYGNIINLAGSGTGQLLCEWSGTDNKSGHLYYRSHRDMSTSGWAPWVTILDNDNYTSYTVKKDGTGATGTWGINITGNAATATTATIASGNLPHFFVTSGTEIAKTPKEATSGWYHMTFGDATILPTSNHGSVLIENDCGTPYQLFFPDNQLDVYKRFGSSSWGTWQRLNAGYAETASRLATARTISLTGAVTGSGSFDGSGNLSIATSVNHTHNYAPTDGNKKRYTFDLSGYSESNFYLITFPISEWELDCEIFNTGGSAARSYNENHLRFVWNKQGWSDSPACLHILYSGCYSASEITIMGLVQGNQNGVRGIAIRGGDKYYVCVNQTPTLRTSNYTESTETFNVGGTSWGTGTNVSIAWTNNGVNQSYTNIPFYGAVWN